MDDKTTPPQDESTDSITKSPDEIKEKYSTRLKKLLKDASKTKDLDPLIEQKIKDQESDRELKKSYANYFIIILAIQLVIMNIIFISAGFDWLTYDKWVLDLYMGGTLAEVFGVVLVITKNLFPAKK